MARYFFASAKTVGRVLDASCGVGYGSVILTGPSTTVFGVDQSAEAVQWARVSFPGPTYIHGEIEKRPWFGNFDTVVSLETIEHLKDPGPAMRVFRGSCKHTFIASVPNEERYPFKAEVFANDESPHYRHYRPEEFDRLMHEHGFTVLERYCQRDKENSSVVQGTDGMFLIYVCAPDG